MTACRISLFVPEDSTCGLFTYSEFLSKELQENAPKNTSISIVLNLGLDDVAYYRMEAKRLEKTSDLIHVQFEFGRFGKWGVSGVGAPAFYSGFSNRARVVTTLHELPHSKNPVVFVYQKTVLRTILQKSTMVIVHTTESRNWLASHFPQFLNKVVVIEHGIPTLNRNQLNAKPIFIPSLSKKKVVGFHGFLSPHKNLELLLEAVSKLPTSHSLLVAGGARTNSDQAYEFQLKKLSSELGLNDRVVWLGFVPTESLPSVFARMDVIVFPYQKITESGAFHRIIAFQKPVVASDLPAFREVFDRYHCIQLFHGASDLAQKILSATSKKKPERKWLSAIKQFTEDRSWRSVAKRHWSLYNAVLESD